ncbi:hypothetical protein WAF00_21715 [Mameliella alba]|uniref:hypothetical protein n=1 Tax=Mameliella alba TaxID=561184 RepID=UPI003012A0EC
MFRALSLAALLATPALGDEVWDSAQGPVVYEEDTGGAAVLSFTHPNGYPARLVIPGLAGNYQDRAVHRAFWVGQGPGTCFAAMSLGGQPSHDWGEALISFDRPAFPTSFTLSLGDCFGPMATSFRALAR